MKLILNLCLVSVGLLNRLALRGHRHCAVISRSRMPMLFLNVDRVYKPLRCGSSGSVPFPKPGPYGLSPNTASKHQQLEDEAVNKFYSYVSVTARDPFGISTSGDPYPDHYNWG